MRGTEGNFNIFLYSREGRERKVRKCSNVEGEAFLMAW